LSLNFDRRKGYLKRSPGTFDALWTKSGVAISTVYESRKVKLSSGGDYTLEAGLEIEINGIWTDQPGTLIAGNIIRVRLTSSDEYETIVELAVTIDGVSCSFLVETTVDPATLNVSFPYTFPFVME